MTKITDSIKCDKNSYSLMFLLSFFQYVFDDNRIIFILHSFPTFSMLLQTLPWNILFGPSPMQDYVHPESFLNLRVRKAQAVSTKFTIIPLNGQIPALVYHRDRIRGSNIHTVEHIFRNIFVSHAGQVVIPHTEQAGQVSRRARRKPIAPKSVGIESVEHTEGLYMPGCPAVKW